MPRYFRQRMRTVQPTRERTCSVSAQAAMFSATTAWRLPASLRLLLLREGEGTR